MVKEQRSSRTRHWPVRSGRCAAQSEHFLPATVDDDERWRSNFR
jgi:hypothetical protein